MMRRAERTCRERMMYDTCRRQHDLSSIPQHRQNKIKDNDRSGDRPSTKTSPPPMFIVHRALAVRHCASAAKQKSIPRSASRGSHIIVRHSSSPCLRELSSCLVHDTPKTCATITVKRLTMHCQRYPCSKCCLEESLNAVFCSAMLMPKFRPQTHCLFH